LNEITEPEPATEKQESNSGNKSSSSSAKTAKSIATSTFGTLFKPSAELVGEELKKWTANKIAERKQRRVQENTERAKIVNPEINDAEIKSQKQIENFENWVEGVAEVEPEDPIAVAWQKILLDITQDNFDTDLLLETLRSLDRSEAAFFASFVKGGVEDMHPDKREHYFQRLEQKNILTIEPVYRNILMVAGDALFTAMYGRKMRIRDRHRLTWVGEALAAYLK